jgi:PKD repeat protein
MKKYTIQFLLLLCFSTTLFAQQYKSAGTAKNGADLEQIFQDNFSLMQLAIKQKAAQLNIPIRETFPNGVEREFVGISPTGMPIYVQTTNNLEAARTISTNRVWPGGSTGLNLTGSGMTNRLGVWDGGRVRTTHQEFGTRANQLDGSASLSDHATHVAGTMAATGVVANAKGMSYQAPINCFDWSNDNSEMSNAANQGMLISNHSYSQISGWNYNDNESRWEFWGDPSISTTEDYKYGFYDDISESWDQICEFRPNYLPFVAAGNDRNEPSTIPTSFYIRNSNGQWVLGNSANPPSKVGPYNSISGGGANAKNVLTVGAVNRITNGYANPAGVVMSSFSGWGPTDDGRIKPDVVANGVAVNSCISTSNTDYATYNGTSMATPNASGSALLIQQHYNNLNSSFMRSSTLKGLIIHTADEAGTTVGPDYTFGWGLMNTNKAIGVISDNLKNVIFQNSLSSLTTYTYTFFCDGLTPIRATVCWTDRPASSPIPSLNPTTRMLVNDLDVRIRRNSDNQIFMPYVLNRAVPNAAATTGDNNIDNVEQINIAAPTMGTYTVTITGKGSMVGGSQQYALILSGITPQLNADFSVANPILCRGSSVGFNNLSSTSATSRVWYFPGGIPATSTALNPSVSYQVPGVYPVALRVSSASGFDSIYRSDYITVGGSPLPFTETFEANSPSRSWWILNNNQNDTTWRLWQVSGNTPGNTAMGINNYDFPRFNLIDAINSPPLDLRGYQNAQVSFDHAYTRFDSTTSDSLIVLISTNCGSNYTRLAAFGENGTGNFATAPNTNFFSGTKFIPSKPEDWCGKAPGANCLTVNLTPFVGNHNVRIRFEHKSNAGNNMYLDNIQVTGNSLAPVANLYSLTRTVCVGNELQLLDSSRNNPTTWLWEVPDADTTIYTVRNPNVMFLTPGLKTITLKVSNATGSDSMAKVAYINVLPSPQTPVVSSSNGKVLCDGDSTVISTDAASNYVWFRNNLIYNNPSTSFTFKEEALFFVRVQGTNGCRIKSNEISLETGTTPAKPIITKDLIANAFCEGGSFNLTSSAATNNQWYVNDTLFSGKTAKVLNSNEAGVYKVKVNDKSCAIFSDSMPIIKLPRPITSEIIGDTWAVKSDTARFSVVGGLNGSIFNWTLTGGLVQAGSSSNAVLIKFNNVNNATVNVQENASNGCKGLLKTIQVNLVNTSLKETSKLKFTAFPNPVETNLSVKFNDELQGAKYQILDVLGRVVKEGEMAQNNDFISSLNVSNLPAGIFVLQISSQEKLGILTFVKE